MAVPNLATTALWWNEAEPAVAIAWVSGPPPHPGIAWFAHAAATAAPVAPLAAVAAWRTHVHAQRVRLGPGRAWQGAAEAVALGTLIPVAILLPVATSRGLAGLAYASAYGVIGALVGLAFGTVLTVVALVVVWTMTRISHSA